MSIVNQKEYLKKYLGIGKGSGDKKKKKKLKKTTSNGLKIVDDDVDISLSREIQEDLEADNEDTPQIVSVIDDRPPSLRVDEVTQNLLWKPIGAPETSSDSAISLKLEGNIKLSKKLGNPKHNIENSSSKHSRISSCEQPKSKTQASSPRDRDFSPPRRRPRKQDDDYSPPRRIKKEKNEDDSPPRKIKDNSSQSRKKSRWGDNEEQNVKLKKTLDGKTAGLQSASDLVHETNQLKKREDELFKNMSAEISGANAATVVRGKKKEIDWDEEERKRKREEENKEKYDKWGKGLKQVEDRNERIKNELYEMSKPLARYADDEDLEKYLKDQEREGDPMLAYIRKKKKKTSVEGSKPVIQEYQGDAPPNRFGIRPGYRWDGVDRSNGYEKQWFQVQNSRKASMDESYKWSTEDM